MLTLHGRNAPLLFYQAFRPCFVQHFNAPLCQSSDKRVCNVMRSVALRKYVLTSFYFQRYTQGFKQFHKPLVVISSKSASEKSGVVYDMRQKCLSTTGIGQITAPLAGDTHFIHQPGSTFQQHSLGSVARRHICGHTACRAASNDNNPIHVKLWLTSPNTRICGISGRLYSMMLTAVLPAMKKRVDSSGIPSAAAIKMRMA